MKLKRIDLLVYTIAILYFAAEARSESLCEDLRGDAQAWYACRAQNGLTQIPNNASPECRDAALNGEIPAIYCTGGDNAPAGEAYATGPNGLAPKECNICRAPNGATPEVYKNCVPEAEFDQKVCDAVRTYQPLQDALGESEANYEAAATSVHQLWDALTKERVYSACLASARNRRACRR